MGSKVKPRGSFRSSSRVLSSPNKRIDDGVVPSLWDDTDIVALERDE